MRVLIAEGADYIGSHPLSEAIKAGHEVVWSDSTAPERLA